MQPLIQIHHSFFQVVVVVVSLVPIVWLGFVWLKRSEDPALLVFKWVMTVPILAFGVWKTGLFKGTPATWTDVVFAMICALGFVAVWRRNIASLVANPLGSLFDGGDVPVEPQPFYSIAESKRKLGRYTEAVAEIRKQLERFPTDYTGQLMLAEIQAQNLNDLPGAELTVHRLCEQPGHAPRNVVHALTTLADWQLKYNLDPAAARVHLERIVELFPDSEFALTAEQRIAHLASVDKLLQPYDPRRVAVPVGVQNLGLLDRKPRGEAPPADAAGLVNEYVKHLEEFPLDFEVREKLATVYADQYQRLDLATDQLQQMIEAPGQPVRNVTRWLNVLADLQVRHGADLAAVQQTRGRIVDLYPNSPVAQMARTRLAQLKLEFKGKEKTAGLKMGTYEQNIGLKQGGPRPY